MKHLLAITFVTFFFVQGTYKDPENGIDLTYTDYEHWFESEAKCLTHINDALAKLDLMIYSIDSPTMTRTVGCYYSEVNVPNEDPGA